jgi:UDP-N-acetylglucosamine 2-epimerase (non-hydrolysing)
VDDPEALSEVLQALSQVAYDLPVLFPVHPRTRKNVEAFGLTRELERVQAIDPVGYVDMVALTDGAAVVLTDSGGLQEETTALGVPCVTLREQTERPITITDGTNRLAPWPLSAAGILGAYRAARSQGRSAQGARAPEGWDGRAAHRIAETLRVRSPLESTPSTLTV